MTCIFRFIFGLPCPTCGVTRALFSLLKGNIASYIHYNLFAVPLCIAVFLIFLESKNRIKVLRTIGIAILILNLPYYFFRLYYGLIP